MANPGNYQAGGRHSELRPHRRGCSALRRPREHWLVTGLRGPHCSSLAIYRYTVLSVPYTSLPHPPPGSAQLNPQAQGMAQNYATKMDRFAGHNLHYQGNSNLKQFLKLPTNLSPEEKRVTPTRPQNPAVHCCAAGLWQLTWATSLSQTLCHPLQWPHCSQELNRIILPLANAYHHASPLLPWLEGKAWLALKICL